jgi:hypothetical protein
MPWAKLNKGKLESLKQGKAEMNARNAALKALNEKMYPKSAPSYPIKADVLPPVNPNNSAKELSNMDKLFHNHVGQFTEKVVPPPSYKGGRKKTRRVKRSRKTRRYRK